MGTSARKQYVPLEHKQHTTVHVLAYAVKPIVAYYQQNSTTLDVTLGKNSWDNCQQSYLGIIYNAISGQKLWLPHV